jgi:hypothetical protein
MKCSNCSMPVKPVVAIDIDGTLGDYHDHFYELCVVYWGLERRLGHWDGSGEFEDWIGINKEQYREAKLAYRQGGRKRWMPMYPGADVLTRNIRDLGCELWLVTTRPWLRLDNIDPDTRWWLDHNQIEFDHLLYGNDEKYDRLLELIEHERIIAVLEDLPDQFDAALKLELPVLQRQNYHNNAPSARKEPSTDFKGFGITVATRYLEWRENEL